MLDCAGWTRCTSIMHRPSEPCQVILNWTPALAGASRRMSSFPLSVKTSCTITIRNMVFRVLVERKLCAAFMGKLHAGSNTHTTQTSGSGLCLVEARRDRARDVRHPGTGTGCQGLRGPQGPPGSGGRPESRLPVELCPVR